MNFGLNLPPRPSSPLLAALKDGDLTGLKDFGFAPTNRVIVLAMRAEIEAALAQGYRLKEIHTRLVSDGILVSDYSSFRRTVRAQIGGGRPSRPWPPAGTPPLAASAVRGLKPAPDEHGRTWLDCPAHEQADAKELGARWDGMTRKAWYVPAGVDVIPFRRWWP